MGLPDSVVVVDRRDVGGGSLRKRSVMDRE